MRLSGALGFLAVLSLGIPDFALAQNENLAAAVFFVESISIGDIRNRYVLAPNSDKKVKILLVPGHGPDYGGTKFAGVYERDIVIGIAEKLAVYLRGNPRYEVMVSRTSEAWHPILRKYFSENEAAIQEFRANQALEMSRHIANRKIELLDDQVSHVTTNTKGAIELYGINKWTSEQGYDIALHIHLNDYGGRRTGWVGEYDGFAVYVPDRQYSNARTSRAIGEHIAARLSAYHATSTLPKETAGVVEDQQLIATGSNNSANSASLLIEYAYIYEPHMRNQRTRELALADYAYQTYLGLQDFFEDPVRQTYGSAALPYEWNLVRAKPRDKGPGAYALQSALKYLGYYPPIGKSASDCPVTGVVGPCTTTALKNFQFENGLEAVGTLGPRTRSLLKKLFPAIYQTSVS